MLKRSLFAAGAIAYLFAAAGSAEAAQIFTDRTAWEDAVGVLVTDTFSNPIANAQQIILDSGIVSTSVGTANIPLNQVVAGGNYQGFVNQTPNLTLEWDFGQSVNAFGGDFSALNIPNGLTVIGDFDGDGSQTISVAQAVGAGSVFFGLIGDASFQTLQWKSNDGGGTSSGEFFGVDNFSLASTPEPTITAALLTLGTIGAGTLLRRKRKH